MGMHVCVAHGQGGIAYMPLQGVENALREAGDARHVGRLLTQAEMDPDDVACTHLDDAERAQRGDIGTHILATEHCA